MLSGKVREEDYRDIVVLIQLVQTDHPPTNFRSLVGFELATPNLIPD
jgi:hypothetical protein